MDRPPAKKEFTGYGLKKQDALGIIKRIKARKKGDFPIIPGLSAKEKRNAVSIPSNIRTVPPEELEEQKTYASRVREHYARRLGGRAPLACVRTFGCQQNVSDSEHMKGLLAGMGFSFTDDPEEADFILFNTCAVREHAVDRVFGNVGALKAVKRRRPETLIAVCGCMVQQEHVAQKLKESYPFVGLVFGTHVLHRLPELLYEALGSRRQLQSIPNMDGVIAEGLPVRRDGGFKAWLPIMAGSAAGIPNGSWRKPANWWRRGIRRSPCSDRMSIPMGRERRTGWISRSSSAVSTRSRGIFSSAS